MGHVPRTQSEERPCQGKELTGRVRKNFLENSHGGQGWREGEKVPRRRNKWSGDTKKVTGRLGHGQGQRVRMTVPAQPWIMGKIT